MTPIELLQSNLLSPMVLAFLLGAIAVWVRSDLAFPPDLYTALSIYLLLAIGLKGGHELAATPWADVVRPVLATLALGVAIPVACYAILRRGGGFNVADAAAIAAHYGSVSAVTFAAVLTFLDAKGVKYEGFMPALVAVLEVPAIVVALLIARLARTAPQAGSLATDGADGAGDAHAPVAPDDAFDSDAAAGHASAAPGGWGLVLREVLAGRSVLLLLGGLAIGYFSTSRNFARVEPLFKDLFFGALVLFLLDMGMVAARRLRDVGRAGAFLVAFAILMPLINGTAGVLLGELAGLSLGGTVVFGVLAASASYIAAPAAVRVALPEANAGYYLTASIGITFPFNLVVGIPAIYTIATFLHG